MKTKTPIKHLIVIFQENNSFDHYFGTYPYAENKPGENKFIPKKNTPAINGLSPGILNNNQNLANPFRLSPQQATTCNPLHEYTALQQAMNNGLMDKFVQSNGKPRCQNSKIVMGYFDGNTVLALWNYAQYFCLNDNYHATNVGASTAGHINLISGNTHDVDPPNLIGADSDQIMVMTRWLHQDPKMAIPVPLVVDGTLINNVDPEFDISSVKPTIKFKGINIGDRLNEKNITWGWFQGGFANYKKKHIGADGIPIADYDPHHNPFQYYRSTSNPNHLPPSSILKIGHTDQANHNYDINDFWLASAIGNVPAVSFFKAPSYQDGHPGYSNPLLEQEFLVKTINRLQKLPQWSEMAIIIAYDDSGGWFDHVMPSIINQSSIPPDNLISPGNSGNNPPLGGYQGRLTYGYRLPFLLMSPYAKKNYLDNTLIDQTSILKFIEYNWSVKPIGNFSFDEFAGTLLNMFNFKKYRSLRLLLDPKTGQIQRKIHVNKYIG